MKYFRRLILPGRVSELKMTAIIASFVSLFSRAGINNSGLRNKYNLPWPEVLHMTITEDTIKNYRHIFVIGDVHGCHEELMQLLVKAKAVGDHTLKVFVGDMLCKGPSNLEVLRAIKKMQHVAVRGNNEESVLRELKSLKENPRYELKNKYDWIRGLTEDEIHYIQNLPYSISFPSLGAIVVHAGLVPGKSLNAQSPVDIVRMRNIVVKDYYGDEGIVALDNHNGGEPWASMWPGPEHIYFGHDAVRKLQQYDFATGLDTGCVYGGMLTGKFIYGPWAGNIVSLKATARYVPI